MNEKEIAEIRRRYRPEKNNISRICGCYVNEKHEIMSEFDQSLILMPPGEAEKLLAILKKTMSGTVNKNLMNLTFETKQVVDSDEHRLLMGLRNSELKDKDAVQSLFQLAIKTLPFESNYLILLAHDSYDVPYLSTDGVMQNDASVDMFSYILCSICPIKMTKPALSYHPFENEFKSCTENWIITSPELGFMFPAFDDRSANIYNSLYYSRDIADNHKDFAEAVFNLEIPMPAAEQKEKFDGILQEALAEDCSYDLVQTVNKELCGLIEIHKTNKELDPLVVTKKDVKNLLAGCGVSDEKVAAFEIKYDEEFGEDVEISPRNIVGGKKIAVRTPDVKIDVNPERSDLIETRVINGVKYILVKVDQYVEVNGVNINIAE